MTKQVLLSALILSITSNMALSMDHFLTKEELELIKPKNEKLALIEERKLTELELLDAVIFTHLLAAGAGYLFAAINQPTTSDLNKHKTVYNGFRKTKLDGNSLFWYLFNGSMQNPYPEFPHTKVIEFTENQTYEDQTTLEELAKEYQNFYHQGKVFKNFEKHTNANNFTFCRKIAQRRNRDGKLTNVHGIVLGSPDGNHCNLYKEFQKNRAVQENLAANASTI
jgi:hypothetical protein